jgi:hypothetical protein
MECKKQILMVNPDNRLTWLKGHNYYQISRADRMPLACSGSLHHYAGNNLIISFMV